MTVFRRRIFPHVLLAVAALSVALPLALVGCGGGEQSPSPAATSPATPAAESTTSGSPTLAPPTEAPTPTEEIERTLTVYSGRTQTLVHPLLETFGEQTGIRIQVKYAGSASTAATLLEEGDNTPADVVFLQDPGSLGSLASAGMLDKIPQETLDKVDARFRDPSGEWIGTSGRARTIIYNTDTIDPERDLPASILDFTAEEWKGRVGWAPRNGSFQSFVTALRIQLGEDGARSWLEGMKENDAQEYPNNISTVAATANGEVDVGFVNHYYLERFLEEHGLEFTARNHFIGNGDPGALVLVAGVGILKASQNKPTAEEFIEFLLSEPAQEYFATETKEYPVAAGVEPVGDIPSLASLNPPNVDLGSLSDLEGTLDLLREVGVLP